LAEGAVRIYTIGHSSRSIDEFIELLKRYGVELVVDVRRSPTSRRYPHFNREALRSELAKHGIGYVWLGMQLGGWRKLKREAAGGCLRSPGFRAYVEHMKTEEFRRAASTLLRLARKYRVAVMCSERLYFRCHRYFLSDWLLVHGAEVYHIVDAGEVRRHKLSRCARLVDGELTYD